MELVHAFRSVPVRLRSVPVRSSSRAGLLAGSEHSGIGGLPHVAGVSCENVRYRVYTAQGILERISGRIFMIEGCDGVWGVLEVISRFPGTFSDGKSFPFDKVMEFLPSASCLSLKDFFYFILLFSIDNIMGWLDEVCTM